MYPGLRREFPIRKNSACEAPDGHGGARTNQGFPTVPLASHSLDENWSVIYSAKLVERVRLKCKGRAR